jgi:hypothetical protein
MAGKSLCAFALLCLTGGFVNAAERPPCAKPIAGKDIPARFTELARRQLVLEYGARAEIDIRKTQMHEIDGDLIRVEAHVQIRKNGADNAAAFWIAGWMNRCQGSLVLRGNTWLADGTLAAQRFTRDQLPGRGLVLGDEKAPVNVVVFVDSRCPHCHRLLGYARELLAQDAIRIEIRQVAYLETAVEAIKDARIHETALFLDPSRATRADDYLDMLGELNSTLDVDEDAPEYERGLALIQTNTNTAREVLRVSTVPAVLVLDRPQTGEYRLTGLYELNRLFQPDL